MTNHSNKIILKTPASWQSNTWREALPAGNGTIGAMVYGGVFQETVLLNHGELWHKLKRDNLPDISDSLQFVRKLMDEKKYKEADHYSCNLLKEKGYAPSIAEPFPFADLNITMPVKKGFKKYQRELDMETGEIKVSWLDGETQFARTLFVSRATNTVVYEIKTNGIPTQVDLGLTLHDERESRNLLGEKALEDSVRITTEGSYLFYGVTNDDGTDFGAVMRVISEGGELSHTKGTLRVKESKNIVVLVKLFVKGNMERDWSRLKEELNGAQVNYQTQREAHVALHKSLFNASKITLFNGESKKSNEELLFEAYQGESSTELVQKLVAFGRYLFISATNKEGLPCPLYGLWCGDYHPIWSQHVANENIEMIYWHTLVGGLPELLYSVFNYMDMLMEDFRENARKLFGCRGINIHAYTSPGIGLASVLVPVITNWTGAAGWIAKFYYDYFLFTGDRIFLEEKALPFLKEVVLFYEDFLVIDEEGYYQFYPSVSPENSPGNYVPESYDGLSHPLPTTINATLDFAIAKEVLNNLVEGSMICGTDQDQWEKWTKMLSQMPPYQINEEGAVSEWMHKDFDDNYNHRHISHIYPVFPGTEVTNEQPAYWEAFKIAVEKRLEIGLSEQSGWSLVHLANIYARFGEGENALECLDLLSRACVMNNFLIAANDWRNMGICIPFHLAPFQIDASMGYVSAVQEMLLYTAPGQIAILPACPKKWQKGSVKNLRSHTCEVSFEWDFEEGQIHLVLVALRASEFYLTLPEGFKTLSGLKEDAGLDKTEVEKGFLLQLVEGQTFEVAVFKATQ